MARRYGRKRRGGGGGFGMNRILKAGLFGIGAAMIAPRFINIDPKIAGAAGGYFGGGLLGAAVGYFAPSLLGGMSGGTNVNW